MATGAEWALGYARQDSADLQVFYHLEESPGPAYESHKLLFLQMACEKLVKAHLCAEGTDPVALQSSHAYVAKTLPIILRQQITFSAMSEKSARWILQHAKHLAQEIEVLAPAVKRGGKRPDNCEYPWTDADGALHLPLDWTFLPSQLVVIPAGRIFLKLVRGAIDRFLS
jgi:hypothetical protein